MHQAPRGVKFFLPFGWIAVGLVAFTLTHSSQEANSAQRVPASAKGVPISYRFGRSSVEFVHFAEERLLISSSCRKQDGSFSCGAYDAFRRANGFGVSDGAIPLDPAAQARSLCKMTGGIVETGKGVSSTDESGFCRYTDGSRLDLGSLLGAVSR